jgi:signal transduction histidine kinase/FixJ family two-component response regulator
MTVSRFVRNLPVKQKLILISMITSIIGLAMAGFAFVLYDRYQVRQDVVQDIASLGKLLADRSTAALTFDDASLAEENLASLQVKQAVAAACIYKPDGSIFARYRAAAGTMLPPAVNDENSYRFQKGHLILYEPILLQGQSIGTLYIDTDLKELDIQQREYILFAFAIIFCASVVAYLLSSRLQQVVSKPLARLTGAALAVSGGKDYSVRVQHDRSDEFGVLIQAFNEMLETIDAQNKNLLEVNKSLEGKVRRRTTELERAKETAESANRAKSVFLANMSHEIRTPMNAVLGFAQLLEKDVSLSADARSKVGTIMKSGEHLLSIINDILEMSRIEAGRAEIHSQSLDLHDLLDDLAAMFRLRTEEKGLVFMLERSDDLPRYIIADLGKVRQVLINLLSNALKFTTRGAITLVALPGGIDMIAVEVEDTGIGISPSEMEKLFHPFERTKGGEQTAGGTGLGLAISREYARLMGGDISVTSNAGSGSTFRFLFRAPVTAVKPASQHSPRRVTGLVPGQGDIRVLVVDDQYINREVLRAMLEPLGFIVEEACEGEEAVEKVHSELPRIVLMDLIMPGMDGIEATKVLRASFPDKPLAIIGISASAFNMEKQNFLDSGLDAFIAKPFREQEMIEVFMKYAGIQFEFEEIDQAPEDAASGSETVTIEKMSGHWREAFEQALALGNITRIRHLGEEAKTMDPQLSAYLAKRAALYDLDGLKKMLPSNHQNRTDGSVAD